MDGGRYFIIKQIKDHQARSAFYSRAGATAPGFLLE